VPASKGLSTRIELRNPDPSANPYLALAVMLAAGLDGIRKKLKLPAPTNQNIYTMSDAERVEKGIISLPSSLEEALEELKNDDVICEALGEHVLTHFIRAKEIEWEMYRLQVHPWERDQYLTTY